MIPVNSSFSYWNTFNIGTDSPFLVKSVKKRVIPPPPLPTAFVTEGEADVFVTEGDTAIFITEDTL